MFHNRKGSFDSTINYNVASKVEGEKTHRYLLKTFNAYCSCE